MKNKNLYILIGILLVALVVLVCIAAGMGNGNDPTVPPETTTQPGQTTTVPTTTATPTTVPPTTAPPEPTVPPTTAPSVQYPASWDGIGLYTRAELEALSRESYGYGPGKSVDGKRAPYAENEQKRFGKYGGNFIGPMTTGST